MASTDQILRHVQEVTDLAVIAITEHDDLRPSLVAREAWARGSYRFDLIPGIEITTRAGHVLGLFLEEPVKSFQTPDATIAAIHRAGGLALIPHPLSWLTRSVGERVMRRLTSDPETTPDGIELSPSPAARVTARRAARLNTEQWRLASYGSSDAHFLGAIGGAVTLFAGSSADDLRRALEHKQSAAELRHRLSLGQVGWRQVVRQQWRGICVTPRKVIGGAIRARLRTAP